MERRLSRCLAAALLTALSACGGGGGGSVAPPPAPQLSVALTNFRATPVAAEVFEGESVGRLDITADVEGDLTQLSGKTIYVVIEDPARLFGTDPVVGFSPDGKGNRITLLERPAPPAGRYQGNVRVFVCLDTACQTQLRNSPQAIPYDVTVLKGLSATVSDITLAGLFGAAPPSTDVAINLPRGATTWQAHLTPIPPATEVPMSAAQVTSPSPAVHIETQQSSVGVIKGTLGVVATGVTSQGRSVFMSVNVPVTYTVQPDPSKPKVIFLPASLDLVATGPLFGSLGAPSPRVIHQGSSISQVDVLYDPSADPTLNAQYMFNRWLGYTQNSPPSIFASVCRFVVQPQSDCLVPGNYSARVRYTLTETGGTQSDAFFPVTLTVKP